MHLSPAHRGAHATDCPAAERIHREGLSLPCSVGISGAEIEQVVSAIGMITR
jgi:dTDP-4-amino-4,6-dideoxygalactose transaminase